MPWRLPPDDFPSAVAADAARLGDLDVRAASVVGPDHRCEDPAKPRQDAYALGRTRSGDHLVLAVADGVSSSRRSDVGARVAVSAAVRELRQALDSGTPISDLDPDLLFRRVAGEMAGTGRARGWSDNDVCCVLVVAVVPTQPRGDGTWCIWTAQVGDVSAWVLTAGQWVQRSGEVKDGLDPNLLPAALPFNPGEVRAQSLLLPAGSVAGFVTDGVSDAWNETRGALEHFAEAWSDPPTVVDFTAQLCFDAPGQVDDRTAVVVWLPVPDEPGPERKTPADSSQELS